MKSRLLLLWLATLVLSTSALSWSSVRYRSARENLTRETARLHRVQAQVQELLQLPAFHSSERSSRPTLAARVAEAMAQSGLPPSLLENLSAETERHTDSSSPIARRGATLTLSPVTLPDLGRFLVRWREREPDWLVTGVDLKPRPGPPDAAGGDLPLRVSLSLERLEIESSPASNQHSETSP